MIKNPKVLAIIMILTAFIIVLWICRDLYLKYPKEIVCKDGIHRTIDIRDFTTTYLGYSAKFEVSIKDRERLSVNIEPMLLQQLSESLQQANEFRKLIVVGFNSCAITNVQYLQYGAKFQVLDNLSRQIDNIAKNEALSLSERKTLNNLVKQYIEVTKDLVVEGKGK
jgi:hypothetical protein